MLASVDQTTALHHLSIEHQAVRDLIHALTDEEMIRPNTIEYGLYYGQECSFKDLLAHLTTYEAFTMAMIGAWLRDEKHWSIDAMRDRGRELHFGGIEERAHLTLAQMLAEWEANAQGVTAAIRALTPEQWRSPAPYPTQRPTDLGGVVESILVAPPRPLYRHLPVHIPDSAAYIRGLR